MCSEIIGKSVKRIDILDKVLGRAKYADDITFPNMLYTKILRSKFPHAKIKKINLTRAEKLIGVKAIITGKDIPVNRFGVQFKDQQILASEKVRYLGEPVAAVAAESEEIAEKG